MTKERQTVSLDTLQQRVKRISTGIEKVSAFAENLGKPLGPARFNPQTLIDRAKEEGKIEGGLDGIIQVATIRKDVAQKVASLKEALRKKSIPTMGRMHEEAKVQVHHFQEEVGEDGAYFSELDEMFKQSQAGGVQPVYEEEYEWAKSLYGQKLDTFLGKSKSLISDGAGQAPVSIEQAPAQVAPIESVPAVPVEPVPTAPDTDQAIPVSPQEDIIPVDPAPVPIEVTPAPPVEKGFEYPFILPDGTVVKWVYGKIRSIFEHTPSIKEQAIPSSELAKAIYKEELERGEIDLSGARSRISLTISNVINKDRLKDKDWLIKNAAPRFELIDGRKKRAEARYYLAHKEEQEAEIQPPEAGGEKNGEVAPSGGQARTVKIEATALLRREEAQVFANLTTSIPPDVFSRIQNLLRGRGDLARGQLVDLARMVVEVKEGKLVVPTPSDYLKIKGGNAARVDHAKRSLQGMIAFSIIPQGETQDRTRSLKYRLGLETNRLAFFLGQKDGKEVVGDALFQLSVAERVLLLGSMSTDLKQRLDYPDLDECSEEQMAEYIKALTYQAYRGRRRQSYGDVEYPTEFVDQLGQIISTCIEREGSFRIGEVIARLSVSYGPVVFERLIETGNQGEFLDSLEGFFQHHRDTSSFARRCAEMLGKTEELKE